MLLEAFPHLTVDVHQPDVTVYVEIRERGAYLHTDQIRGAGGLPVGTSGRAMLLISGGIDSPVAGYMMGKSADWRSRRSTLSARRIRARTRWKRCARSAKRWRRGVGACACLSVRRSPKRSLLSATAARRMCSRRHHAPLH